METVEVAEVHTPFETVHTKEFVPVLKALTGDEGLFIEVTFPEPAITDQAPVPLVGVTAANVAVVAHTVWFVPAFEVGCASRMINTVDVAAVHAPFETVHTNEFVPVLNAVTGDEGLFREVTFPEPTITDQAPVPIAGLVAASVAVVAHTVWFVPALEVGCASRMIETVEVAAVHAPLETVQTKELVPVLNAVTCEEGLVVEVTFPEPAITDHAPLPLVGVAAASVAVVAHTV